MVPLKTSTPLIIGSRCITVTQQRMQIKVGASLEWMPLTSLCFVLCKVIDGMKNMLGLIINTCALVQK